MKIQYVADDGQIFTNETDCRLHEEEIFSNLRMYNLDGNITDNVGQAVAINLKSEEAADCFINKCFASNCSYDGISKGDCGIFVWDDYDECYRYISYDATKALYSLLVDEHKNDDKQTPQNNK